MSHRRRPLPLTAGFWLLPIGAGIVALSVLLLVAELAALPIATANVQTGSDSITRAWPLLGTGVLALAGAGAAVRGRISVQRHRQYLERRAVQLRRMRTPESAGVSPGVAGTAHRAR